MSDVSKKILLVDDSDIDRTILNAILEGGGYIVDECASGWVAVEQLKREVPDVMLLDISMPQMDGFEVLSKLDEMQLNFPVFMITSEATEANVKRAMNHRICGFLKKPFDRDFLLNQLSKKLDEDASAAAEQHSESAIKSFARMLKSHYSGMILSDRDRHYHRTMDLVKILMYDNLEVDGFFLELCDLMEKLDKLYFPMEHTEENLEQVLNQLLKRNTDARFAAISGAMDHKSDLFFYYTA